ncbi:papilin [Rhipicephalus sanguineus]|uniref:papilin n=1 Tax=Rhipicephalus sanguineus TaxID=34632 RepID=UPI0020C222BD|nr:papilin [Rhipicephalus sanguineus]
MKTVLCTILSYYVVHFTPSHARSPLRCRGMPREVDTCPVAVSIEEWYYNKEEEKCTNFMYGECPESSNKFESEAECIAACITAQPEPPKPPKVNKEPPRRRPPTAPRPPIAPRPPKKPGGGHQGGKQGKQPGGGRPPTPGGQEESPTKHVLCDAERRRLPRCYAVVLRPTKG